MLKYFKMKEKHPIPKKNYTTTYPPTSLSFEEWCKELNVSLLSGKKSVYIY